MSTSQEFLQWATVPVIRQLDAGGYSPQRRGALLDVYVNAPGILQADTGGREFTETETTDDKGQVTREMHYAVASDEEEYARTRRVVVILFQWPADQVARLDDALLNWLYNEGMRLRKEWRADLKNG